MRKINQASVSTTEAKLSVGVIVCCVEYCSTMPIAPIQDKGEKMWQF